VVSEQSVDLEKRLRISDYRALLSKAGFEITQELNTYGPAQELEQVPLAPEFRGYSQGRSASC